MSRIDRGSKKQAVAVVIAGLFLASIMAPVLPNVGAASGNEGDTDGQSSLQITRHRATADEISQLKEKMGVYEPGRNYNVIVDGHGTGLAPPTEEGYEQMADSLYIVDDITNGASLDGAPSSVDNSQDVWFPPIGNQDGEGSCVCFAVAYYTKTYQEAKDHGWDLSGATWEGGYYGNPSPAYQDRIMSPDFVYHQVLYWDGDDAGSTYQDAMNLVNQIGCASWEKMPYDPTDSTSWPSEAAWREAPLYRGASGYSYQNLNDNTDLEDLKTYLSGDNLGVISINANYYGDLTSDDLWTVDNYDGSSTNHANTIVGYDDNFGPYTEEGNTRYGAFKVANSWGKGFGGDSNSDGCYWISYEAMKREVGYYMFMNDQLDYEPELLATFEISHSTRTQCDIDIGLGSTGSPQTEKQFNNWWYIGAPSSFPSNIMALDVSEFADSYTIDGSTFFIQVYDGGDTTTGTITNFSMEHYTTYDPNGTPSSYATSSDPPVSTVQSGTVYAETTLTLASPPAVSTNTASNIATTSAQLNGNLDSLGSASSCDVWFVYDTTSHTTWQDYTMETTHTSTAATGSFSDSVTGLNDDTTYYYRAVASSSDGTAQGSEGSFTTVANALPTADFSFSPIEPGVGESVSFTDLSSDSDGSIVNWTWAMGDGTTSYEQHPTHSYDSADTYTVQLTVRDDSGDTDTTSQQVTVSSAAPTADFTYTPASPGVAEPVSFTDESSDSDGSIVNWTWQFDDGTTSYVQHPSHSYDASGIYTVTLTVTDDSAQTDTVSKQVTVYSDEWNNQSNPPHTYIIPEGNVGIGTDTPETKLDVNGSLRVQGSSASHLFFVDSSTGNVGIGTNSPNAPLHVSADYPAIRVEGSNAGRFEMFIASDGRRPALRITGQESPHAGDFSQWVLRTDTGKAALNVYDVSTETWKQWMTFDYLNERLVIGQGAAYNPVAQIEIPKDALFNSEGGDYDFRVESAGNSHMLFVDADTNNVGIGINTPERPLHINDVMRLEPRSSAPSNPSMGDIYMDSDDGVLKVWDGDEWRNCYTPN